MVATPFYQASAIWRSGRSLSAYERGMSGKKKLFRQGVDLANSRRMRVRRRARPRIVRHATRQIIIVVTIAVAFWATMDFFVETWLPHNSERTTPGEKS